MRSFRHRTLRNVEERPTSDHHRCGQCGVHHDPFRNRPGRFLADRSAGRCGAACPPERHGEDDRKRRFSLAGARAGSTRGAGEVGDSLTLRLEDSGRLCECASRTAPSRAELLVWRRPDAWHEDDAPAADAGVLRRPDLGWPIGRHPRLGSSFTQAAISSWTAATELSNISFSSSANETSTMRSTPFSPRTIGTPT